MTEQLNKDAKKLRELDVVMRMWSETLIGRGLLPEGAYDGELLQIAERLEKL